MKAMREPYAHVKYKQVRARRKDWCEPHKVESVLFEAVVLITQIPISMTRFELGSIQYNFT